MGSLQQGTPLGQTTIKNNLFHLQTEFCAPGTQTRIADIDSCFCREFEKFFVHANFIRTHCIWKYTSPKKIRVLLSFPQSGVNALHIVIAVNFFTLVCNVISVLVEMVLFTMVKIDTFCKIKLIPVYFKLFDEKYARIVVSESER